MENKLFVKILLFIVAVLLMTVVVYEFFVWQEKNGTLLEVAFLDVGQGDATLVNYLNEYQILIDGGPSGKKLMSELAKVMPKMDRTIELVILTHSDTDHLSGLVEMAKKYEVGLFLDNGQEADSEIYEQLKEMIVQKEIRKEMIPEGSKISIGKHLSFVAYNPDELAGQEGDRNESSVVLRMDYGENSFLFTGDAEFETENDVLNDLEDIDVDWLKVGHHGSNGSTSEEFLQKVSPKNAVISVGQKNRYGHPRQEVLERLSKVGAKVFRTDENGTIMIECENLKKCDIGD